MFSRNSICCKARALALLAKVSLSKASLAFVMFFAAVLLTGCFSAGDDFYSYIILKGSIQRDEPADLITVEVDSRGTLLSNEQDNDNYEVSIGAVENCNILWTVNNVMVQTAVVYKKWDAKNHLTGMDIKVTDERTGKSWTVYSEVPDSREWVIELNQPDN